MPKLPKGKPKSWIASSKKKTRFNDKHISENASFYQSRTWQKVRKAFFSTHPLCLWCEQEGVVKEGDVVDHIVEIKDGGAELSLDNLQTLCHRHHAQKTAWAKMKRKINNYEQDNK